MVYLIHTLIIISIPVFLSGCPLFHVSHSIRKTLAPSSILTQQRRVPGKSTSAKIVTQGNKLWVTIRVRDYCMKRNIMLHKRKKVTVTKLNTLGWIINGTVMASSIGAIASMVGAAYSDNPRKKTTGIITGALFGAAGIAYLVYIAIKSRDKEFNIAPINENGLWTPSGPCNFQSNDNRLIKIKYGDKLYNSKILTGRTNKDGRAKFEISPIITDWAKDLNASNNSKFTIIIPFKNKTIWTASHPFPIGFEKKYTKQRDKWRERYIRKELKSTRRALRRKNTGDAEKHYNNAVKYALNSLKKKFSRKLKYLFKRIFKLRRKIEQRARRRRIREERRARRRRIREERRARRKRAIEKRRRKRSPASITFHPSDN